MTVKPLVVFKHEEVEPLGGYPANWTVIAGSPVARNWLKYNNAEMGVRSGVWECTPGTFTLDHKVFEFCHLVEGEVLLTAEHGGPELLKAGDAFTLSPGFKGTWEVLKTVTKHYVVKV